MTTIAYKDGILAYDSRRTHGTTISYDDCEKLQIFKGVSFLLCGAVADFDGLIAAYFGGPTPSSNDASGYALDGGVLWLIACDDNTGLWKERVRLDRPDAQGSGSAHALTAMDMGASAIEAVEMAKKRDTKTGGEVKYLAFRKPTHDQTI